MAFEDFMESERRETVDELSDLFFVVQEMGRRLANETHGDAFAQVRKLNVLLHEARVQLSVIKNGVAPDFWVPQTANLDVRRSP